MGNFNRCSAALVCVFFLSTLRADDSPQFLGEHRNGYSPETELIDSFPDSGPALVWRSPLGVGMSGVVVSDGMVYTMFQDSDHQYVAALDEKSGKQMWTTKVGPYYQNGMGNGPRATPSVNGNKIFGFTGEGILCALNAKDGALLWTVNTPEDLKSKPAEYGMASSPLVAGDAVIVQVGSSQGAVAAYSKEDGTRLWTSGSGASGYSSPVIMTLAGKEQIVAFLGTSVSGIDPTDGSELWKMDFVTDYDCNTANPVQLDDSSLLVSAGENHGCAALKITGGDGGKGFEVETLWSSLGKTSVLRAEWQTPVLQDGYIYGLDNVGGAGPFTHLVCLRVTDGKQMWIQPKFGKTNLTLADGKLFFSTMRGDLVLVKAKSDGFEEVSRAKILERQTRQAPVIANRNLYLRDDKEVVCLKVSRK